MLLVASTAYPEPPLDGDKFRWANLLRPLARLGPLYAVFGFMPTAPTREARHELFERSFGGVEVVPTPAPEVALRAAWLSLSGRTSAFGRRATPSWRRAVAAAVAQQRPRAVLLLGTSAGYLPPLPSPTWLDLVDIRSRIRSIGGDRVDRRLLKSELSLALRHDLILTSTSDRAWLLEQGVDPSRVAVVANGVDPTLFDIVPATDSQRILFVGNLRLGRSFAGLRWFLRECWPLIRAANGAARLRIVGYGADRIAGGEGLEIFPDVADVRPHYGQAALAIAPLLEASGVQNKALQAMAAALPLACTSPVARGFFDSAPAWKVADDPRTMADTCLSLLHDRPHAADLAARGRAYVREHHDWGRSAVQLRTLLLDSRRA